MVDRIFESAIELFCCGLPESLPPRGIEVVAHESRLQRALTDRQKIRDVGVYRVEHGMHAYIRQPRGSKRICQMLRIGEPLLPWKGFSRRIGQ